MSSSPARRIDDPIDPFHLITTESEAFYAPGYIESSPTTTSKPVESSALPHETTSIRRMKFTSLCARTALQVTIGCMVPLAVGLFFKLQGIPSLQSMAKYRCQFARVICFISWMICLLPLYIPLRIHADDYCAIVLEWDTSESDLSWNQPPAIDIYIKSLRHCAVLPKDDQDPLAARVLPAMDGATSDIRENFASRDVGALIIPAFTSPTYGLTSPGPILSALSLLTGYIFHSPHVVRPVSVLDDNVVNGECWEFLAMSGQVGIKLAAKISISHISLDYVRSDQLSPYAASKAPQDITIWALVEDGSENLLKYLEKDTDVKAAYDFLKPGHRLPSSITRSMYFIRLASIHYDAHSLSPWQKFALPARLAVNVPDVQTVVVTFDTNRGSDTTCIYTIGIHGVQHL